MKYFLGVLFISYSSFLFAYPDIKIIKSDKSSLVFEYTPCYTDTSTIIINSSLFRKVSIQNGNTLNEEEYGNPAIQVRPVNIGLPIETGNTFEILSYQYIEMKGDLIPKPKMTYKKGEFISSYELNQDYYGYTGEKNKILEIGSFVKLRGLPVQKLLLKPVEFDANKHLIRLYKSIVIRIIYARIRGQQYNQHTNPQIDGLLKDAVINYDQASYWIENKRIDLLNKPTVKNTVLSEGKFFRFEISEEGMYKIDRTELASLGIDVNTVNPKTIKIFNNGGKVLPENISAPVSDDLQEIAIYVAGQEDNKFDEGDYILFYGRGIQFWDFDSTKKKVNRWFHPYSVKNYYYITSGNNESNKRIRFKPSPDGIPVYKQTTTKAYFAGEEDKFNPLKSGRIYMWDMFTDAEKSRSKTYRTKLNDIVENSRIEYKFAFGNKSVDIVPLSIFEGDNKILTLKLDKVSNDELQSRYTYKVGLANYTGTLNNEESSLKFVYEAVSSPSEGFLDYYEISYTRYLRAVNEEIKFFSGMDTTGLVEYYLNNFKDNTTAVKIFDITDYSDVKLITGAIINGGDVNFRAFENKAGTSKYIALGEHAYKKIGGAEEVSAQNLHGINNGAKFIIITHKDFLQNALRLKEHKESKNREPISTIVVTVDQIYNEFSGTGSLDVSAIRNFIKYAFDNWVIKPEYILLFGDGDYDYKNAEGKNQNYVIPYESENSFDLTNSYCSDDFYVQVSGDDYGVDLAIGRINVISPGDAESIVDKIIKYETQKDFGEWRNRAVLVADDENGTAGEGIESYHTVSSEYFGVNVLPGYFNIKKIYTTQYPSIETGEGRRKPKANEDIIKSINEGTLILNYYGHGAADLWAQEHIFVKSTSIPALNNHKLFFLTALTCSFGLYDNPGEQSASEALLLKSESGAIAVFSASRAVHPNESEQLNLKLYSYLFGKNYLNSRTIGEACFLAKFNNSTKWGIININDAKYHLFGDPTIRLKIPELNASIDSVDHHVPDGSTKIKALSTVQIYGTVKNEDSTINESFNGEGILTVYDSKRIVNLPVISYKMQQQGGILFKSRVSIVNGVFSTEFTVPKDISYENKEGKIVLYAVNKLVDALGFTTGVIIGGTDTSKINDGKGPDIEIIFDGEVSNGNNLIGPNSDLKIKLSDKTGLNTTGAGIGHKFEGILNDDEVNSIDFTGYFLGDLNSGGKRGVVDYRFSGIETGDYKLKVKAWDVFNNSNEQTCYFNVVDDNDLVIRDLFNYPNPFSRNTSFLFQHNFDGAIDIKVKVYTVAGRLIKVIEEKSVTGRSIRIDWDGRDEDGNNISNGTYLYKLIVGTTDGRFRKELVGKLAVIR